MFITLLSFAPVFSASAAARSSAAGRILLQTESRGEAWYVPAASTERTYLANGTAAYDVMRAYGLGMTNTDLKKIPAGLISDLNVADTDSDGLPDNLEEALGTDMLKADSDEDGYSDGDEVSAGYNPLGLGKSSTSAVFTKRFLGRILLQVQGKGQAWFVNPADGKRYYMSNGEAAYQIMKKFGLSARNSLVKSFVISNRTVSCGFDKECFVRSAENAQPALVNWESNVDMMGMFITSVSEKTVSKGFSSYVFSERTTQTRYSMTDAQRAEARSKGLTDALIDKQLSDAEATTPDASSLVTTCQYQDPLALTKVLRKWENGNFHVLASVNVVTGKTTLKGDYEDIGECVIAKE
ncbi:MAG: thrombospondin type 3 repeat-containing protein [Candidatus Uhrbacteria bacterium]